MLYSNTHTAIRTPEGHACTLEMTSDPETGTVCTVQQGSLAIVKRSQRPEDVACIASAVQAMDDLLVNLADLSPRTEEA